MSDLNNADRTEDRAKNADWYVVHTYSGYENKVKTNIEKAIENRKLQDQIFSVRIPMQDVLEVKEEKDSEGGTQRVTKQVSKKMFPGYVLVHMEMNPDTWFVVRNTRGVTGFVGPGSEPVPLSEEEIRNLGIDVEETESAPEKVVVNIDIKPGDHVLVVSGAYAKDTTYEVLSVNMENQTVTIPVMILGKEVQFEVGFLEIKKSEPIT